MLNSEITSAAHGDAAAGHNAGELFAVRPARLEEAEQVHILVSESMDLYCKSSGVPKNMLDAVSESLDDVRADIMSVPFFVAVDSKGILLGSVRLLSKKVSSFAVPDLPAKLSLAPDDSVSYFSRFAVREDLQGLGVGSLLFLAAQKTALDAKSPCMLLHTSLNNQIIVAFYKKRGFFLLSEDPSRGYPRGLFGKNLL